MNENQIDFKNGTGFPLEIGFDFFFFGDVLGLKS